MTLASALLCTAYVDVGLFMCRKVAQMLYLRVIVRACTLHLPLD